MYLIVGLGNPGTKYRFTRHNVGFLAIDNIGEAFGIDVNKKDKHYLFGRGSASGEEILLLKPTTYMNLSGKAVLSAFTKYKISPNDLIVIYDDVDLPVGKIRIREKGSSGGHKGVQSIISMVNNNFIRIRVGIGKDENIPTEKYVLSNFTEEEFDILNQVMLKIPNIIKTILEYGIVKAMNEFN